jgi:nucleotide-binding universal stress UspA family protein
LIHIRRILYATDFSSYSNQAYFHAVSLAKAHQATLVIVYVYDPNQADLPSPPSGQSAVDYWREQLEQIRPLDDSIPVEHHLLIGEPATELVAFTRQHPFNLVVMGTHGRTGLDRLLLGSVAEQMLRESPCSVLVVKIPQSQR